MSVRTGVDEYNQPISDINSGYIGEFKYFGSETVPPHCLACDGSEVSRETYNELFEVFGETYGAGDGETTFNLPDFRGAFLRCIGGNAAELGVQQDDAIRNITGRLGIRPLWDDTRQEPVTSTSAFTGSDQGGPFYVASSMQEEGSPSAYIVSHSYSPGGTYINYAEFRANRVVQTANENRPINYAVNICVVFE